MIIINTKEKLKELISAHANGNPIENVLFEHVQFSGTMVGLCFVNCDFDSCLLTTPQGCVFHSCKFVRITFDTIISAYFDACWYKKCKFIGKISHSNISGRIIDCEFYRTVLLHNAITLGHSTCEFDHTRFVMCQAACLSPSHFKFINCDFSVGNRLSPEFVDFPYKNGAILQDKIIGFKAVAIDKNDTRKYVVAKLEIPVGSIVISPNGTKCRTNKAKVIGFSRKDVRRCYSRRNGMSYYIGDEFNIKNFDMDNQAECSTGIHFFKTESEARAYARHQPIKHIIHMKGDAK